MENSIVYNPLPDMVNTQQKSLIANFIVEY